MYDNKMLTGRSPQNNVTTSGAAAGAAAAAPHYISNTLVIEQSNPLTAAKGHVKTMVATLDDDLQNKMKKLADDFVETFHRQSKLEKAIHREQSDGNHIMHSVPECDLAINYIDSAKGCEESKHLDIETTAVKLQCRLLMKELVVKGMQVNFKYAKLDLLKSLARCLSMAGTEFVIDKNVSDDYDVHQAIADMFYCYGPAIIDSLNIDATIEEFVSMYNKVSLQQLPSPTKVVVPARTITTSTTTTTNDNNNNNDNLPPPSSDPPVHNPYVQVHDDASLVYHLGRGNGNGNNNNNSYVSNIPNRGGRVTAMVAGLSQADFSHIMSRKVNEDDNVCYEEFYQISRMARDADNSVVTPTTTKKRSRDVNNAATATAASATDGGAGQEAAAKPSSEDSTAEPTQKRARNEAGRPFTQDSQPDDGSKTSIEEEEYNKDEEMEVIEVMPTPKVTEFLAKLGTEKAAVVNNLHWMAISVLAGSSNLYAQVNNINDIRRRKKTAMEELEKEQTSSDVAYRMANEKSASLPVLEGVVDLVASKKVKEMERQIQSLSARLDNNNNKEKKKEQGRNNRNNNNNNKGHTSSKKDPRGGLRAAASTKKNNSNNKDTSKKQHHTTKKGVKGGAGGKSKGTGQVLNGNRKQQQQQKKPGKSRFTSTKKDNQRK